MNRNRLLFAVVVALAMGAAWWLWRDDVAGGRSAETPQVAPVAASSGASVDPVPPGAVAASAASAVTDQPDVPSVLVPPGATPRRLAGRVTFDGKPVADAEVRVSALNAPAGLGKRSRRTGADGRFDFGQYPGVAVNVVAIAAGLAPAEVRALDLANAEVRPDPEHLELALTACEAQLLGRVTDTDQHPIYSAQVALEGTDGVRTDADGAYELCVPRGGQMVHFSADGFATLVSRQAVNSRTVFNAELHRPARLDVTVVDADDGRPIRGAVVRADQLRFGPSGTVVTVLSDDAGLASLDLAPGPLVLGVWLDQRGVDDQTLEAKEGVTEAMTVRLTRYATLEGRVIRNGAPVAGVRLAAHAKRGGHTAVSDTDGRFSMRRVRPGPLQFLSTAYAVVSPAEFEMPAHDATVDVEVRPRAEVNGRVTDRGGQPVGGAMVQVGVLAAKSDADGRYRLQGLDPGTYAVLATSAQLGAYGDGGKVTVAERQQVTKDLVLEFAARIEGRVVTERGEPVADAVVHFVDNEIQDECDAQTDLNGRFRCASLSGGGKYQPWVELQHSAMKPAKPFPLVEVAAKDSAVTEIELVVKGERLKLSGIVRDAQGAAAKNATVRALALSGDEPARFADTAELPLVRTDAKGRFTFDALGSGVYALQARSGQGEAVVPAVQAGSTDVAITLVRKGRVQGVLVGFSREPQQVFAHRLDGQQYVPATSFSRTDFAFELPVGQWQLYAVSDVEADTAKVEVRSGETARVTLTNRGTGRLEGLVLDAKTNAPLEGVQCAALTLATETQTQPGAGSALTRTDRAGRFATDAPAGPLQVRCGGNDARYRRAVMVITLERGGSAQVKLALAPAQ